MIAARILRTASPVLLVSLLGCGGGDRSSAPASATPASTPVPAEIVLFFPGDDTMLHREARQIPELPSSRPSRIRVVLEELLAGSHHGWAPVFPWAVAVEAVFVDRDGNAYIDLSAPPTEVGIGSAGELALAYAVVHSVTANAPGIERVQLLFGGRERPTLGHLDLSRPLAPMPALVAP